MYNTNIYVYVFFRYLILDREYFSMIKKGKEDPGNYRPVSAW